MPFSAKDKHAIKLL